LKDLCRLTVERTVVSQIYVNAMFPNGDADISRDDVLSAHIRRLAQEITPGHRDLRIPRYSYNFRPGSNPTTFLIYIYNASVVVD
jgi:hypothetical protein